MIERDEVFRIKTARKPGTLARVLVAIGEHGAQVGDIATVAWNPDHTIRDVTAIAPSAEAIAEIRVAIAAAPGVEIIGQVDNVFQKHEGGKIATVPTVDVRTLQDVREIYTPGVARVSSAIADDPSLADRYTWRRRTVAIVSNGTRVLGLGNIGPAAALPVMEGKALFYSLFVGLNAVPIMLDTENPDEFVDTVMRIAPGFGAIHLEDIASPGVYQIESELDTRLPIPVMHDDQHGTATVVLAAALAAADKLNRRLEDLVFGQVGLGAAGSAIAGLAATFPFKRIVAYDPDDRAAAHLTKNMEPAQSHGLAVGSGQSDLDLVVTEADVLVLTTGRPGLLSRGQVRTGSIVFAISNPVPEISIEEALAGGAAIAADGAIVNNVLGYPGLFRGALDSGAATISPRMLAAAAVCLASLVPPNGLLPHPLDVGVHEAVAAAVAAAS